MMTIERNGTIEVTPNGEFKITGFSHQGARARELEWLAVDRALAAIAKVRAGGPRFVIPEPRRD